METWIFQGNPKVFDIDGYLAASSGVILWRVSRYAEQIAIGDSVYIWRSQPQPLGGERFYVVCPVTGRRCTTLFLPPGRTQFASAVGWQVPYRSTRLREVDRAIRTMREIKKRSQALSKYARQSTRQRLWH